MEMEMNAETRFFLAPNDSAAKQYIKAAWQIKRRPFYRKEIIIPAGSIEIIFNFSKQPINYLNSPGHHSTLPKVFINGVYTAPITLEVGSDHFFFGIRLFAHTIKQILRIPAGEFANSVTDLNLVHRLFDSLWHQLAETPLFQDKIEIVMQWLCQKWTAIDKRELGLIRFFDLPLIGHMDVGSLTKDLFYSSRHLSRKVNELFGISTEALILYKKYLQASNLLHHTDLSLTQIAHNAEFYDQSHFIREFKAFTGFLPGQYRKIKSELPSHLYFK